MFSMLSNRTAMSNRRTGMVLGIITSLLFFATLSPVPVAADCTPFPFASSLPSSGCCVTSTLPSACKPEVKVEAPAVVVEDDDVCMTEQTRLAIKDNVVSVFSNFVDGNPNGMLITEIPLSAIRAVTDEEKASNLPILVYSADSEFADGWHVNLYWFDNHYGTEVIGSDTFYDDTANCAGF